MRSRTATKHRRAAVTSSGASCTICATARASTGDPESQKDPRARGESRIEVGETSAASLSSRAHGPFAPDGRPARRAGATHGAT